MPEFSTLNEYAGDGSTTVWQISFTGGYLSREHVKVQVFDDLDFENGVPVNFSFISDYSISITPAVSVGKFIRIYRDTPTKVPIVDFSDGSVINERTLDQNAKQAVFALAEIKDRVDPLLADLSNADERFKGSPGGNVMAVGVFSAIQGMTIPVGVDAIRTTGPGASWYIAFNGTDALVLKHPLAITKTANGRYFRLSPEHLTLKAFGADPTGAVSAVPALRALIAYCGEPTFFPPWSPYAGGRAAYRIDCGVGTYKVDEEVSINGFVAHWRGGSSSSGGYAMGAATRFKCTFTGRFRLDRGDTGPLAGQVVSGADGSVFEGIVFEGSRGGYNLFTAHCTFRFEHTSCIGSGYHGLYIQASSGATDDYKGNASSNIIIGGDFSYNLGSGICSEGADANASRAIGFSAVDNSRYGVEDISFLGNHWDPVNLRSNQLGHIYIPNANATGGSMAGYEEGGSPLSHVGQNCLVVGGTRGSGYTYNSPYLYGRFGCVGANGVILERKSALNPSKLLTVSIATSFDAGQVFTTSIAGVPGDRNLRYIGNDLVWGNGQGANDIDHIITGVGTTYKFGRANPASYGVNMFRRGLSLGNRIWTDGLAAPTTGEHARGEIVWNYDPAAGGTLGWVCVQGGTPGVWKTFGNIAA